MRKPLQRLNAETAAGLDTFLPAILDKAFKGQVSEVVEGWRMEGWRGEGASEPGSVERGAGVLVRNGLWHVGWRIDPSGPAFPAVRS